MSLRNLLSLMLLPASVVYLGAQEMGEPDLASDEFMQRFSASYGVLSEKEPPLDDIEIVMLKKIAPLIRINKTQAQNFLQSMVNSEEKHSASFNYLLGNIYFENNEFLLAETQYKAAIEAFPDFQRAWTNLGVLKLKSGDTKSALISFLKAVELGDSKSETFGMLGYCHFAEGNYISAEVAYNRAVLAEPDNLDWLEGKAQTYLKAERYVEAIRMQDELIARRPRRAEYWLAQTNAYLGMKDHAKAARNLEIIRSLGDIDFQSLYLLGGLYSKLEMWQPARDAYLEAAEYARPGDTDFLIQATKLLAYHKEMEAARELYSMIDLTTDGIDDTALSDYKVVGADIAIHAGDTDQAIALLEEAEGINPTDGNTLVRLARLHAQNDNTAKAYMLLDRAEMDPQSEYDALLTRIKLLIKEDRFAESQTFVGRALKLRSDESTKALYDQIEAAAKSSNG
ncbi:tetratricopeptide repeat protein [Pelagicoccus sp. SDUM812002]|uniref:tetratricopeptide repeat protein n=1 Tax=Pelagicoccus sp. SDUM812002 TaxID=3041266 RepID=UPI0028106552|nr:tetratricopeptide repeat protein [Pelagicoccus sp. SDUM812002]MDQ8186341.1 tetratricopeptide repeat protein [Pelagicoccus sp. SDUM812002]